MKLTKEEAAKLKILSDALYPAVQALAKFGNLVSLILEENKQSNQLTMNVPDAPTQIKFTFDKNVRDEFAIGSDMYDAYDNIKLLPTLGSEHAAAYDLRAFIEPDSKDKVGTFALHPMATKIISTNLKVEVPIGYELIITPRSGMSVKGITISNSPGTIDADYRGVVGIILYNNSGLPFTITHGDRIAQCKLKRLESTEWTYVDKLSETKRGEGGFGSTGVK